MEPLIELTEQTVPADRSDRSDRSETKRTPRTPYPSAVSDDEWAFVAPYLTLMTEEAPQREPPLREVFNGLRWRVRTGAQGRLLPHDLPPGYTVYQQTQRWLAAGVISLIWSGPLRSSGMAHLWGPFRLP